MEKEVRKRYIAGLILLLIIIGFIVLIIYRTNITGKVVYDDSTNNFCGAEVTENSELSANHICNALDPSTSGGNLTVAGIYLNCSGFTLRGNNLGSFGIKTTAPNINITRCVDVRNFINNLNITSTNVTIIDSNLSNDPATSRIDAWLNNSVNATFINVTFTSDAKITVSTSSMLFVKYYVIVNVTNSTLGPINGANVTFNDSAYGSNNVTVVTSSNGLSYFNLTDRIFRNSGDGGILDYIYSVNASYGRDNVTNSSFNLTANAGYTMLTLQLNDSYSPTITLSNPPADTSNTTTAHNFTFNVTDESAISSCTLVVDNTAYQLLSTISKTAANGMYNSSFSVASHTWSVNCTDTTGNVGNSSSRTFTVQAASSSSSGSSGSSGGGATLCAGTYLYTEWGECINGQENRTRYDISICHYSNKTEVRQCAIENATNATSTIITGGTCEDECNYTLYRSNFCRNDIIVKCGMEYGCYANISVKDCGVNGQICLNGECVEPRKEIPKEAIAVAAGTTAIVVVGGIIFWWLWLLALVPFFLIRLRHYSVSIIDASNLLKIVGKNNRLSKDRLLEFLKIISSNYGSFVFADKNSEAVRYLIANGFLEVRMDEPFIVVGHFTKKKHAKAFALALRKALDRANAHRIKIMLVKERMSWIGAIRQWRRMRKSEREIRRAMGKLKV